jgi:glycosyltransferase involved in cell wall biosynthesis
MLVTYNQEEYVKLALDSINSQDYENIELIISDDCSSDGTWSVINSYEFARDFFKVRKIKQSKNRGLITHLNTLRDLVHGELVLFAAGDDISDSERVSKVVEFWESKGSPECSIFTNAVIIDSNGKEGEKFYREQLPDQSLDCFVKFRRCWIGGFSHACTPRIFPGESKLYEGTFQEDGLLAFRAIMMSGIYYLDYPTVKYRRHANNSYNPMELSGRCKIFKSQIYMGVGRLSDLVSYRSQAGLGVLETARLALLLLLDVLSNSVKYALMKGVVFMARCRRIS